VEEARVPRGANVLVSHEHQPTPAEFRALQTDGANLVQLSIEGIQRTDPPYVEDTVASGGLALAVRDALAAGLSVVIAVRTGPGLTDVAVEAQTPGLQSKVWVDTTARREFIRMWQRIAITFGREPRVVGYNLIVEPLPEAAVGGPSSRPDSDCRCFRIEVSTGRLLPTRSWRASGLLISVPQWSLKQPVSLAPSTLPS